MMMRLSNPTVSSSRMAARPNKASAVVAPRRCVVMRAGANANDQTEGLIKDLGLPTSGSSGKDVQTPSKPESQDQIKNGSYKELQGSDTIQQAQNVNYDIKERAQVSKDAAVDGIKNAGDFIKQAGQDFKAGVAEAGEDIAQTVKGGAKNVEAAGDKAADKVTDRM